jgi:F0F1-type ATP synthase assembly protein I
MEAFAYGEILELFFYLLLLLIDLRKMLHEGFLPLMISKEEEVADPIKKK